MHRADDTFYKVKILSELRIGNLSGLNSSSILVRMSKTDGFGLDQIYEG